MGLLTSVGCFMLMVRRRKASRWIHGFIGLVSLYFGVMIIPIMVLYWTKVPWPIPFLKQWNVTSATLTLALVGILLTVGGAVLLRLSRQTED